MKFLTLIATIGLGLILPLPAADQPNFVVIMTDDQGYGDLSCYGANHVSTPRIDQMAKEGARLTSFYVAAPVCTPSRAALMTGCYPKRVDMATGSNFGVLLAGDRKGLNPDEITIAEVLKGAGYATGMFGKWHLGDQPEFLPTRQGFDEFFGIPFSHDIHPYHPRQQHFQFPPLALLDNEKVIEMDPDADFLTKRFTERAVDFIRKNRDEPFFLYLPHPIPHKPLHVSPPFMEGVDPAILETLQKEGEGIDYKTRDKLFRQAISEIDWSVGRILDTLKEEGIDEDTLVIFFSDNGPAIGSAGPLKGRKGSTFEGGMREPTVIRWPGKIPAGGDNGELMTAMDLLPTFAKLAGAQVPGDRVIDGKDIWPVLSGKEESPHRNFFYHRGNTLQAVRSDDWKLHVKGKKPVALHDLATDIGEQKNVLAKNGDVANRLLEAMAVFEDDIAENSRPAAFVDNPKPLSAGKQATASEKKPAAKQVNSDVSRTPNVVLIFADDLGYGDLGCYGATRLKTPNIDKLAAEGRRFTDAHSASAVCTPSRYGLLTGEYPFRANHGKGLWGPAPITSPLLIDPETLTIADVFKAGGYDTAVFGKWHLGFKEGKNDWQEPLRPGPQDLGFDHYFGMPVVNSAPPYVYVENDRVVGGDPDDPLVYRGRGARNVTPLTPIPPEAARRSPNAFSGAVEAHRRFNDFEVGTTLAGKATEWIESRGEKPFFAYVSTTNIHHPFTPAKPFQGTSEAGWYGDFVHEFDWIVGEVMQSLENAGVADNTLVLFTSDNGGMFNLGGRAAAKLGHKINGNLLGSKFGIWEGGHRVPFIAWWPGQIEAGTVSDQLFCSVDLLASFAALTGQKLDDAKDSINMLPALTGNPDKPLRTEMFMTPNKPTHMALRRGKWMYIPARSDGGFRGSKPSDHAWGGAAVTTLVDTPNTDIESGKIKRDAPPAQLYDLEADVNQTKNLYYEHPEVVQEMAAALKKARAEAAAGRGKKPGKQAVAPSASKPKPPPRPATDKPNFVVIFADDLGYGDISAYRSTATQTPHLDALAAEGFRSLDFFVPANVCSPSRAALLTGRYPMRCGMPVARNEGHPKYRDYGFLASELTIPELLSPAGYRSLIVGKWHLGMEVEGSHPLDAGFDEHLGIASNYETKRGSDFSTLYRGKEVEARKVPFQALTRRYTDEAIAFIERNREDPFLIYFSHHIPHTPHLPRKEFVDSSGQGKYGDVIKELDDSTGRIMQALRDAGLDDNTLVVFTSDNGPGRAGSAGGLNGGKFGTMEGGHRVPGLFRWPGQIPSGQISGLTLTSMDLLPLFCGLAGVDLPGDRKIDGKDIFAILQGKETASPHEFLYYYNGTNLQAVREGQWKLHLPRTAQDQPFWNKRRTARRVFVTLDQPALFDLKKDRVEKQNVAGQHPEVVARLQKHAEAIRAELGDVKVEGSDQRAIKLEDPQER